MNNSIIKRRVVSSRENEATNYFQIINSYIAHSAERNDRKQEGINNIIRSGRERERQEKQKDENSTTSSS